MTALFPDLNTESLYLQSLELAHHIVDLVEDRKAEDILLLDLRPDNIIADFFIICSGDNERHLRALTEIVRLDTKERFQMLPFTNEGTAENVWVVMDYGDVVVHFFSPDRREY
ncbi:MAG: ribosome silencing factor, partial [Anaerolineae bacterium]|nr:ribosome silencing factor [Anaerolineae bacterium]